MAVKIRMTRGGRRNRPFYRIGAFDARTPREGKSIEILGHYDPLAPDEAKRIVVDRERVEYWFHQGAIPTPSVASLLKPLGILFERQAKRRSRPPRGGGKAARTADGA